MSSKKSLSKNIYNDIKQVIDDARSRSFRAVNFLIVEAYWNIGKIIVEEEQKGKKRADYGRFLITELSDRLTKDFGNGFSENNLWYMRQFYITFPIVHALSGEFPASIIQTERYKSIDLKNYLRKELSWTHYRILLKLEKEEARLFYMNEAANSNWSTRELDRQINSLLFERLSLSKNKKAVLRMAKRGQIINKPNDLIKDPYVLEFLGLENREKYYEADLEKALIDHLQKFLLELGKGFSFISRQKRITLDSEHFYIDLVFYNRLTKSHILFDLKVGKLTHQDIGQMQMYVNYFNRKIKLKEENETIGIILCAEKNNAVIKFTLPPKQKQIFISRYIPYLPTEEELKNEIMKEKLNFETRSNYLKGKR